MRNDSEDSVTTVFVQVELHKLKCATKQYKCWLLFHDTSVWWVLVCLHGKEQEMAQVKCLLC